MVKMLKLLYPVDMILRSDFISLLTYLYDVGILVKVTADDSSVM